MKKIAMMILAIAMLLSLTACSSNPSTDSGEITTLKFGNTISLDQIKELDGHQVTITGYMATMSPISGKYMYLMNMPYQSCPFCVPNTTELSNTLAVYAPEGKTFDYTDQAIQVTGTIVIEDCVDEFGYAYSYRIADASYEVVDMSNVSEEYALWQAIATEGIVADVNSMFDYVHFLCQWTEYQSSYLDENGETVTFNLYPGDVSQYLADDSAYGYAEQASESYFPGLISRIRAISPDKLEDLVAIVEAGQAAADAALTALNDGAYSYDEAADKFTLTDNDALYQQWYDAYLSFAEWMARWEL